MAGSVLNNARGDRVGDRALPGRADVFDPCDIHADAVNLRIGRNRPNRDWNIVMAAFRVDDIAEQERLTVFFRNTAAELPAHQRVHFSVLIHGCVDPVEQTGFVKAIGMLV